MTEQIRCQTCPRVYAKDGQGTVEERARAAGWIVWEGATLGGDHTRRVHCAGCLGRDEDGPQEPRWDATCNTCGVSASEDGYDEFFEEDAEAWADEHRCEPDTETIPPKVIAEQRRKAEEYRRRLAKAGAA
jgi:hypothetical protein